MMNKKVEKVAEKGGGRRQKCSIPDEGDIIHQPILPIPPHWMCKNLQDLLECADAIANGEPDEGFEGYSDLKATYGRGSQLPTFIHHVTNMYQSSPMSL